MFLVDMLTEQVRSIAEDIMSLRLNPMEQWGFGAILLLRSGLDKDLSVINVLDVNALNDVAQIRSLQEQSLFMLAECIFTGSLDQEAAKSRFAKAILLLPTLCGLSQESIRKLFFHKLTMEQILNLMK